MNFRLRVGADLSLDLEGLVMRGINMEYKGGTSLIYKVAIIALTNLLITSHAQIRQPQSSATIFSSGKVNMVGSKSEEEARAASRKVGRSLQKLIVRYPGEICPKKRNVSEEIRVRDFQVRNVWASTQLPWDIRIQVSLSQSPACVSLNLSIPGFPSEKPPEQGLSVQSREPTEHLLPGRVELR